MTAYRTAFHLPAIIHADTPARAEKIATIAQAALLGALIAIPDGQPHHDTPAPVETVRYCAHCHRPARQPVLISKPGESAQYACLPVCPPRDEQETAA